MAIKLYITDEILGVKTFIELNGSLEEDCANILASRYNTDYFTVEIEDISGNITLYEDYIYE